MGIASRTTWERRVYLPLEKVKNIDSAKLAHRARIYRNQHPKVEPMFAERRQRQEAAKAKAELKALGHRIRRRAASRHRGWMPRGRR